MALRIVQSIFLLGLLLPAAQAQQAVTFATNWKAQAAHGGFYQAVADGTYKKYGLDVTIRQGGPQVNNRPLLPARRVDFLMTGNLLHSFDNVKNGIPVVVVAAMFQKDPQALMAHPGQGYENFAALKNAPTALIAKDGQFTWWQWLKVVHGFKDETLKPAPQKNLRLAFSKRLTGGYGKPSAPITGNYWAEGPTAIRLEQEWVVYFDKYMDHLYGAVSTVDWVNWKDISEKIHFPKGARHGTVLKISAEKFSALLQ